jgi:hypothetical protein
MKGREVLGRPAPLWILAVLGTIGGLLSTIVLMQFAEVIPWAGDEASYIGGRWTGVVAYGLIAGLFFGAAYAWITVKRWAHMVSILAALIGFFIPFMSYMDGTDPRSSALAPIVVSVLMLFMVFRPSTNRAMAAALAGQGSVTTAKAAPPPKPMSAARKRELAAEEKKKAKAPASPTPAAAPAVVATPSVATSPAVPAAAKAAPQTPVQTAASMVMSAASSLKSAAATPASPRKGVTVMGKPATPPQKAATPPPAQPAATGRVPGLRADEV